MISDVDENQSTFGSKEVEPTWLMVICTAPNITSNILHRSCVEPPTAAITVKSKQIPSYKDYQVAISSCLLRF